MVPAVAPILGFPRKAWQLPRLKNSLAAGPDRRSGGLGRRSTLAAQLAAAVAFRLPLLAPLALSGGAAIYLYADAEPRWITLAIPFGLSVCGVVLLPGLRMGWLRWVFAALMLASLGAGVAKLRAVAVASPVLEREIGPVRIEGRLVEIDANDRNRRLRLETYAVAGLGREDTPRFVRFSYRYPIEFVPGRSLSCLAFLSPPPRPTIAGEYDFGRAAWFEQLGAVGFAVNECQPLYAPPPSGVAERASYVVAAVRRTIAEHVVSISGAAGGAFAAAVVTGDRSYMDPADVEALRQSGLAHLLAISGLHMALAGGAFFLGLRVAWPFMGPLALRMPAVKVAAAGAIIGCTLYFLLSGGSVATQRAFIMALIAFSAKLLDKPALSLRSLSVAFVVIVLIHPEAVITPGFQMSFAATAALIGSFEAWPQRRSSSPRTTNEKFRSWGLGVLTTSVTASVATFPFALFHFERAASLSVLANLIVTPMVSLWAAPAAVASLVASIVGLQEPFLKLLGAGLGMILSVAHWVSDIGWEVGFNPVTGSVLGLAILSIALFGVLPGRLRYLSILALLPAAAMWFGSKTPVAYVGADGNLFVRDEAGWVEFGGWRVGDELSPLSLQDELRVSECRPRNERCLVVHGPGSLLVEVGERADHAGEVAIDADCLVSRPMIRLAIEGASRPVDIDPCRLAGGVSVEVFREADELQVLERRLQTGRPWSPPSRVFTE